MKPGFLLRGWPKAQVALAIVLGSLTILFGAGLLYTSGALIAKAALRPPTLLSLITLITAVRFFGVARAGVRYAERLLSHNLTLRYLATLRHKLFAAVAHASPYRLHGFYSGDLLSRVSSDVDTLQGAFLHVFAPFAVAGLSGAATVLLLSFLSPLLAGLTCLLLLLSIALLPYLAQCSAQQDAYQLTQLRAHMNRELSEGLRGVPDLLATAAETKLEQLSREVAGLELKAENSNALFSSLTNATRDLGFWLALCLTATQVASGTTDATLLAAVSLFVLSSFEATANLTEAARTLGSLQASAARTAELLALPSPQEATTTAAHTVPNAIPSANSAPNTGGALSFTDVSFSYGAAPVLHNLNLHLAPGSRTAILGPSGAGKSTLAALLLGFLEAERGTVALNGAALRAQSKTRVRRAISWSGQRPHLFATSLRENLRLGNPELADSQMWALLDRLGLAARLRQRGGLDMVLGEYGTTLSGGEWSRLAVARALLKPSQMVVLDEPTAHLDAEAEVQVMEAVLDALGKRTLLIMTHRTRPLAYVERVLRLEHGNLTPVTRHSRTMHSRTKRDA